MGNTSSGMKPPDIDPFQTLVKNVDARLLEDGTVDSSSVRFNRVLLEADDNVVALGGDPNSAPLARRQQFLEVLDDLGLPGEAKTRLETQYHFQYGDGHRALEEVGGKLGRDGLPDLRSLKPDNLEIATANRYRAAVETTPDITMRGQLETLLNDLRVPEAARPELIGKVHADERHFSWLANGQVPAEMGQSAQPFRMADDNLMKASRDVPLPQDTRDTLLENAGSWAGRIKDVFSNDGAQYGVHLNYLRADVNRTASDIGGQMFRKTVEAGYNLSNPGVLTAYCEAVMTQTTERGHTTQIASRAGGGIEAELGERQVNSSLGHGSRH